jgi:histidine ammonia-lyase
MVKIGELLTIEDVVRVARHFEEVTISSEALYRMERGRAIVEAHLKSDKPIYGVNTGFGALSEYVIGQEDLETLQLNLVRSHSCGAGEPLPIEIVRASMLLRAQVLTSGLCGVRPELSKMLIDMLNARIHPLVPSKGSVGASGDLAPLAHIALCMIGEGFCVTEEGMIKADHALRKASLKPVVLKPKEGLSLVNGTQVMTGAGALALFDAEHLCLVGDIVGAMSLDAAKGSPDAFDERVVSARPHKGATESAHLLRMMLKGSEIRESHRGCKKVQDPYSLRCMPQVHGAVRDALSFVRQTIETEINSVTDNPLVFEDGAIISGGNFHGEPIAMALDLLAIAVSELAAISERRVEHILNPSLSGGLSPFLGAKEGLCSGMMIAQVLSAALVSQNKVLAHPASVDSIPSSANKEDHVSMGMTSALKAREVVENVLTCLSVEALCASNALLQRRPLRGGAGVRTAEDVIWSVVEPYHDDRPLSWDIEKVRAILRPGGGFVEKALSAIARMP